MGKIIVSNLGKAFKQYPSKWSRLAEWVLPGRQIRHSLKWVIENVSFTVSPGEAVGIIGINGAGKSTLLKMITGTTQPSIGSIEMTGRVAALLELGMGFHPDFTGRENVHMSAQLLGIKPEEISNLMPEIIAFAEIDNYIDQPVRVYSSGMQMRLAFSVATAIRPDILIIDEALSVGDAYFQHKSFDRIRKFRKQGTTLLIVSHDKQAIQSICDKAILLNSGRLEMQGKPEAVMDYYNALLASRQKITIKQETDKEGRTKTISGTGEVFVSNIHLKNEVGEIIEMAFVGQPVFLEIEVETTISIPKLVFGYSIKDRLGKILYGTNTAHTNQIINNVKSGAKIIYRCYFNANFGSGNYSVQTALVSSENHLSNNYEWRDLAIVFDVINKNKPEFAGIIWIEQKIRIEAL